MSEQTPVGFDRERWREEYELRKREIEIKEHEAIRDRWSSPLIIAILTAAVAGLMNAAAIVLNGVEQRKLEVTKSDQARSIEETKAEAARIFEVIKTGSPSQAATNLKFLVDVGLISDAGRRDSIKALDQRATGQLPALPPLVITPPQVNWNEPPPVPTSPRVVRKSPRPPPAEEFDEETPPPQSSPSAPRSAQDSR
jgi:hypothetical protein